MEIHTVATGTPLVFLLTIASMVASASLLMRVSAKNRMLGELPKGRFQSLEGLRGLLATSVFAGHCVIALGYMHTAQWQSPKYVLYAWATKGAVALFFMITGLLFWTKVLDSGCDWRTHFRSRIKRIYPLYVLMASLVLIAVAVESGMQLKEPALKFVHQLLYWLLPGITGIDRLNGVAVLFINAGVLWTLQYEWGFYALLPVLALLFRRRTWLMAVAYLVILGVTYFLGLSGATTHLKVALPLLLGCLSAAILRGDFWRSQRQTLLYQWTTVVLVVLSMQLYLPGASTLNNVALLWPAFTLVAGGVSVFGALLKKSIVYLGRISFGVYLMHGIFLYGLREALGFFGLDPLLQDWIFLASIAPMAFALTWFCTTVHFWVELPFMKTERFRSDVATAAA